MTEHDKECARAVAKLDQLVATVEAKLRHIYDTMGEAAVLSSLDSGMAFHNRALDMFGPGSIRGDLAIIGIYGAAMLALKVTEWRQEPK